MSDQDVRAALRVLELGQADELELFRAIKVLHREGQLELVPAKLAHLVWRYEHDVGNFEKAEINKRAEAKAFAEAMENEALRRRGTHVYHPAHGVIPNAKAADLIQAGKAKLAEFKGHPETGAHDLLLLLD